MMRYLLLGVLLVGLLAACQPSQGSPTPEAAPATATAAEPPTPTAVPPTPTVAPPTPTAELVTPKGEVLEPKGFIQRIHDPVIAHEGDTYYVFSTGSRIPIIRSKDKVVWEFSECVLDSNPAWTREVNPNLADIWAPDISYFNNQWHVYYAVSSFGSQRSAIGLATNVTLNPDSPDYKWVDQGPVLRSRVGDPWNAIDPNLVLDEQGEPWLAWGSFWTGLWMGKVSSDTGQLEADASTYLHLADRSAGPDRDPAIEAPFIVSRAGKWYLFASFDRCCQGAQSTYNVRVGRSDALTGPYVDRDGVPMTEGGGTLILSAYGQWKGPGHNGMLIEDDVFWMVYHAYDAHQGGISKLRIESLAWDADGWPVLSSQTAQP